MEECMFEPLAYQSSIRGLWTKRVPAGVGLLDLSLVGAPFAFVMQRVSDGEDVLALVERLRARRDNTPVIVVSKKGHDKELLLALASGADDSLDFDEDRIDEFAARLFAMTYRRREYTDGSFIKAGPLIHDTESDVIWSGDKRLQLSPLEKRLLGILIKYPGNSLDKRILYDHLFLTPHLYRSSSIDRIIIPIQESVSKSLGENLIFYDKQNVRLGPDITSSDYLMAVATMSTLGSTLKKERKQKEDDDCEGGSVGKTWRIANVSRQQRSEDRAVAMGSIVDQLMKEGFTNAHALAIELTRRGVLTVTGRTKWHPQQVRVLLFKLGYKKYL